VEGWINKIPNLSKYYKKEDTSWHDDMVKQANQSFKDAADKREAEKRRAAKKPARKPAARKR